MASESETFNVATALASNTFIETGYTFNGWNTAPDGSGTTYLENASYPFTASITLYAQWTINTYTVTFDANGGVGVMASESETFNVATALASNTFIETGYTFNGWNTSPSGGATSYANGALYSFTANITLYAQWTLVPAQMQFPGLTSSNWAGYLLAGGTGGYQAVSAEWIIPTLNCASLPNSSTADWVGVNGADGFSGLFQDGSLSRCSNGHETTTAWWTDEAQGFLTQSLFTVASGDLIEAEVYQQVSGVWVYYIKDLTTGQSSSSPEAYSGAGMTAEWIAEDSGIPGGGLNTLADFGIISFTDLGLTVPSGSWTLPPYSDAIEMVAPNGSVEALPSPAQGSGASANFTVTYEG